MPRRRLGLAFLAALNPKLLAVDLVLMQSERQREIFACFLIGGMGVALAVGLLDVLIVRADAIKVQGSISAGLDLGAGSAAGDHRRAGRDRQPARPPPATSPGGAPAAAEAG